MVSVGPKAIDDAALFAVSLDLNHAREAEALAKSTRIVLEEKIAKLTGFSMPDGGSKTFSFKCDDGSAKLTLKQGFYMKSLADKIKETKSGLGKKRFDKVFRTKYEPVKKALDDLKKEDRDLWLIACAAIESSLGKVGVELKSIVRT